MKPNTLFLAAALLASSSAFAVSITPTVSYSAGTTLNTSALSTFTTSGAQMAGTSVTAYFNGGTSETISWLAGAGTAGAATGTGWSLGFAGSTTFSPSWEFLTSSGLIGLITRLVIDGRPGDTIFDTILDPETSPGSARGTAFSSVDGPEGLAVAATYTNQVAVGGIVYGDLYTVLDISFLSPTGAVGGLGADSRLLFTADTDNTLIAGDITTIPEPGTIALLGLGLIGLALKRRRN